MIRLKLVWSITITNHINYNWMYSLAVRGDLIWNILNMIEQRGNYLVLVSLFWRPLHNYTCVYTATSYTRIIQHPGFVQSESFKNVTFWIWLLSSGICWVWIYSEKKLDFQPNLVFHLHNHSCKPKIFIILFKIIKKHKGEKVKIITL